ncbi:MAG: COR domain-containing protein [Bacteroidales bacterium]
MQIAEKLIQTCIATQATFLDLGNCGLTRLPESIKQCTQVEVLVLSRNYYDKDKWAESQNKGKRNLIKDLAGLEYLKKLTVLYANENKISNLAALENCKELKELSLNDNQVQDISYLQNLIQLKELKLSYNQVQDISYLQNLTQLQKLYLYHNKIQDISHLQHLTQLQILDISCNQIQNISHLQHLAQLEGLGLWDNQIQDLRPLKNVLPKLLDYYWHNNNLLCPSQYIADQLDRKELYSFLTQLETYGEHELREAKVLLIGQGQTGKSSLAAKLKDKGAELPTVDDTTRGIVIESLKEKGVKGRLELHLWDFGGQEIYHPTHQFFFSKQSIYVLVDNTRTNNDTSLHDKSFSYWLQTAELLGEKSPVFILQNEKDKHQKSLAVSQIQERFPNVRGIYRTDLKALDKDWAKFRRDLIEEAEKLPHIGTILPKNWVKVRNELKKQLKKGKNFLRKEEYLTLCERLSIKEEKMALLISEIFHYLGEILHFQDNLQLENLLVLSNVWVTTGIYRVLDAKTVKEKGRFNLQDLQLKEVWGQKEYSTCKGELLELMKKFDICYELPQPSEYLVPQLLSFEKPHYEWNKEENVRLEYHYSFMPKGIINRLTVRLHQAIEDSSLVWKVGVILKQDETRAEIVEVAGQGILRIRIEGKYKRELMYLVVSELDTLNAGYDFAKTEEEKRTGKAKVEKKVACNCEKCRDSNIPHLFLYDDLTGAKDNGLESLPCMLTFKPVNLDNLLNGTFLQTIEEVRLLIGEGKLKKVFEVLEKREDMRKRNDFTVIQGRFSRNEAAKREGTISHEKYEQECNKIGKAILEHLE